MKPPEEHSFSGERLLTIKEVADIMRCNRMTIYRMVHEGKLPHARLGATGSFRIDARTLQEWQRRQSQSNLK